MSVVGKKRPEMVIASLKQRNEQLQKSLQNVSQDLRSLKEERRKDEMAFEQQRRKEITKLNREIAWRDQMISKLQEEVALHSSRAENFRDALQNNFNVWQNRPSSGEKEALARERKLIIELEELKRHLKTQTDNWDSERREWTRKLHEAEREVGPLRLKLRQYLTRNVELNAQNQKLQSTLVTMRQNQKGKGAVTIAKPWDFSQEIRELRSKLEQKDKEILALRQSAKDKDRQLRREQRMLRSSMFLDLPPLIETDFDSGAESLDIVTSPTSVKSADSWTEHSFKPDLEALFRQLSQEHSHLQNAYQNLLSQLKQLTSDVTSSTSDLRDASVLKAEIQALQVELTECREQNELLEFRILELEEFREKSSERSDTREMWTDTEGDDVSDSGILSVTSYQTLDEIQSLPDLTLMRSDVEDSFIVQKLEAAKEQLNQLMADLHDPVHKSTLLQLQALLEVCQQWNVHTKSRSSDSEKSSRANSPRERVAIDKLQESGIFEAEDLKSTSDSSCQTSICMSVAGCQTDFKDKEHFEDLEKYYLGQIEQLQSEKSQWRKSLTPPEAIEALKEQLKRVQVERQAAEEALEHREEQLRKLETDCARWRHLAETQTLQNAENEKNLSAVLELMAKIHAKVQTLFPDDTSSQRDNEDEDVGLVVQYLLKKLRSVAENVAQLRAKEAAYEATLAQADILVLNLQKELEGKTALWASKEAEWQGLLQNGDSLEDKKECNECLAWYKEKEYWQVAQNRWQNCERELRHKLEEIEDSEAQTREKSRKLEAILSQKERLFYQEMRALQDELQSAREAYENLAEMGVAKEKQMEELREELNIMQTKYGDMEIKGMEMKSAWDEDQENFRLEIVQLKQTLSWSVAQLSENEVSRSQLAEDLAMVKEELEKYKCLWQQETAKAQHLTDELAKSQFRIHQSTDSLHSQLKEVMDAVEESPMASRAASPQKESSLKRDVIETLVMSVEDLTQLDDFVDQLFEEITSEDSASEGGVPNEPDPEDLQRSLVEKESMLTVLDAEANDLTRQLKAQTQRISNLESVVARLQSTNSSLREQLDQFESCAWTTQTTPEPHRTGTNLVRRASAPQPRPRTKFGCVEQLKSSVNEDPNVPAPGQLRILRRVGTDGLLLAWNPPARELTAGFVIWVDDLQHQRVRSAHRTKALLHGLCLDSHPILKITMRTVGLDGRYSLPATIVYKDTPPVVSTPTVPEAEAEDPPTESKPIASPSSNQGASEGGSRRSKIPRFHGNGFVTVIACNVEDSVC